MTPVKNTIVVREFKVATLDVRGDISLWIDIGHVTRYILLDNGIVVYPGMDDLLYNIKNIL